MARSLDANIYGHDEDSFASSIASDALGAPNEDRHSGSPTGESGSKGGGGGTEVSKSEVVVTKHGTGDDGGARTKGNHGSQE